MRPKPRAETARQVRAFEDYWSLGPTRTVVALAANYRRMSDEGQKVPTRRKRTLDEWSATYYWPERAAQRERDEAAEEARKNAESVRRFRKRAMRAIEIEASAFLQKVSSAIGPDGELGAPVVTRTASDFSKLVNTYLQLAGEPQKHEVSATLANAPGETFASTVELEMLSPRELAGVLRDAADIAEELAERDGTPEGAGEDGGYHGPQDRTRTRR